MVVADCPEDELDEAPLEVALCMLVEADCPELEDELDEAPLEAALQAGIPRIYELHWISMSSSEFTGILRNYKEL